MSPERKLERQLLNLCKERGIYCRKWVSPGRRGVPDRILIGPDGAVAFIELKSPGKTPDALQKRELELIRKQGARAYWVSDFNGARAAVDSIDPRVDEQLKALIL